MKKIFVLLLTVFCSSSIYAQQVGDGNAMFIDNFNKPIVSGIYNTNNTILNYPPSFEGGWKYLFVMRHGSQSNNHQFQVSSHFEENDRVFFRKISSMDLSNKSTAWHEFATRGENLFTGTQTISGDLYVGKQVAGKIGYGNRLMFWGNLDNLDDMWIAKYNEASDRSDLRINIGDDFNLSRDRLVVGSTFHQDSKWYELFVVASNGNVGIGVSDPSNKLEVNGTIRAKEIKVETGWADFVFAEDYQLPSLSDIEAHINTHQHLPGIPTESEVKENGVNIGEIQVKLLQKIEELTLYVIQMQKEIEELKSR